MKKDISYFLNKLENIQTRLNPIAALVIDNYPLYLLENKKLYTDYLSQYSDLWRAIYLNENELAENEYKNIGYSWSFNKASTIKFMYNNDSNMSAKHLIHCKDIIGLDVYNVVDSIELELDEIKNEIESLDYEDYEEIMFDGEIEEIMLDTNELIDRMTHYLITENEIFVFDDKILVQDINTESDFISVEVSKVVPFLV